jgi:hypothetical protein
MERIVNQGRFQRGVVVEFPTQTLMQAPPGAVPVLLLLWLMTSVNANLDSPWLLENSLPEFYA